jgi:hypothetical protein
MTISHPAHLNAKWHLALTGVAAVVLVGLAWALRPAATGTVPPTSAHPVALAPHPFLTNHQASVWVRRVRLANVTPPRLDSCFPDPRTWGADKTRTATYHDPRPNRTIVDTRMNEYLLQYADTARAHRAFLVAFGQAKGCAHGDFAPIQRPGGGGYRPDPTTADGVRLMRYDEGFAAQWGDSAMTQHSVVRVARAGNVLVIIEDATLDDHYYYWLAHAVDQALPDYRWHSTSVPPTTVPPNPPTT